MTAPVYIDETLSEVDDAALAPGSLGVLTGPEARHAVTVKRTQPGERLDIVDTRGLRVRAEMVSGDGSELRYRICETIHEPAPARPVTIVQALIKDGRDEAAVEICTEFGAHSFIPWIADRSQSVWKGPKLEKGRAKWENIARAAMKQSRRAFAPTVADPIKTTGLAAALAGFDTVCVCWEEAESMMSVPASGSVAFVIGPEGGFSDRELELLAECGAQKVRLTQAVLRSGTAGAYALASLETLDMLRTAPTRDMRA